MTNPLKYLIKIIKKQKYKKPKHHGMYAVLHGDHVGRFLLFVDYNNNDKKYSVLALPEMATLYISEKDVHLGLTEKLLDLVEILPDDMFKLCQEEFTYRQNIEHKKEKKKYDKLNNRWQQLVAQGSLGNKDKK